MLTVARTLMHREHKHTYNGRIKFAIRAPATHTLNRAAVVTAADWRDMGEPDVITVTVIPGDELNP